MAMVTRCQTVINFKLASYYLKRHREAQTKRKKQGAGPLKTRKDSVVIDVIPTEVIERAIATTTTPAPVKARGRPKSSKRKRRTTPPPSSPDTADDSHHADSRTGGGRSPGTDGTRLETRAARDLKRQRKVCSTGMSAELRNDIWLASYGIPLQTVLPGSKDGHKAAPPRGTVGPGRVGSGPHCSQVWHYVHCVLFPVVDQLDLCTVAANVAPMHQPVAAMRDLAIQLQALPPDALHSPLDDYKGSIVHNNDDRLGDISEADDAASVCGPAAKTEPEGGGSTTGGKGGTGNRRPGSRSKTGFTGVWRYGKRFQAHISHQGTRHYLGSFSSAEAAAQAYDVRATIMKGPAAKLNFGPTPSSGTGTGTVPSRLATTAGDRGSGITQQLLSACRESDADATRLTPLLKYTLSERWRNGPSLLSGLDCPLRRRSPDSLSTATSALNTLLQGARGEDRDTGLVPRTESCTPAIDDAQPPGHVVLGACRQALGICSPNPPEKRKGAHTDVPSDIACMMPIPTIQPAEPSLSSQSILVGTTRSPRAKRQRRGRGHSNALPCGAGTPAAGGEGELEAVIGLLRSAAAAVQGLQKGLFQRLWDAVPSPGLLLELQGGLRREVEDTATYMMQQLAQADHDGIERDMALLQAVGVAGISRHDPDTPRPTQAGVAALRRAVELVEAERLEALEANYGALRPIEW